MYFKHTFRLYFQLTTWDTISRYLCVSCVAAASDTNDPEGSSEVGGYMTPRSLETPVCASGHHLTQVSHFSKATSSSQATIDFLPTHIRKEDCLLPIF